MAQNPQTSTAAQDRGKRYRLSDLSRLSGVSREMLKYYFRVGLLPRAKKSRAGWSSYGERELNLTRLVREYQSQTPLTLPQIAEVFQGARHDVQQLELGLLSGKFERQSSASDVVVGLALPPESDTVAVEVPEKFLAELREAGLAPTHRRLNSGEERVAALIHQGVQEGLPLSFFVRGQGLLEQVVEAEMEAMMGVDLPASSVEKQNARIVESNRLINRWLTLAKDTLLQKRFIKAYLGSRKQYEEIQRWIYVPSEAFVRKHGIEEELKELEARAAKNPKKHLPELAEGLLVLGRNDAGAKAVKEALAAGSATLQTLLAAIRVEQVRSNFTASAELTARILELYPEKPAALAAAAIDAFLQASRTFASNQGNLWLAKAARLHGKALASKPDDPRDLFDRRMLQALSHANLPGAFGGSRQAEQEVALAIEQLHSGETLGFALPSMPKIHEVAIYYYLAQIRVRNGDAGGADQAFREVVQRDPASHFGAAAFEKIGGK